MADDLVLRHPLPPLRRAHAFTVVMLQSHPATNGDGGWSIGNMPTSWQRITGWSWHHGIAERLPHLAERMRNVVLENRDALDLLTELADREDVLIYVDPPYADTVGYRHDVDRAGLHEALRAQRGKVLVSGYDDEWDVLGWRRESRAGKVSYGIMGGRREHQARTESVWANYPHAQTRLLE